MAKTRPNEKRVQLSFMRPEDLALHAWMTKQAYDRRLTLPDFILLALGEAFDGQYEECNVAPPVAVIEIPRIPEPEIPPPPIEAAPPPPPVIDSGDDGYEATKARIAQDAAMYPLHTGKGVPVIPLPDTAPASLPVPPELASSKPAATGKRRGQSRRS